MASRTSLHRRALLAAGLATPWALRAQTGPAAAAPHVVPGFAAAPAAMDGEWRDASRARGIPWRVRWPAGAGPLPLVLYSHGLGGSREGGDAWGEAWRAAGIAVLHLQHPGSDADVLRAGLRALRGAASAEQLVERVRDMRFAMDEVARRAAAGEAPWTRVRADAIGVAGHSFGAHTTQALAGQRYRVPAEFADARPRAFIALSPSAGRGDPPDVQRAFGGIARPFLAVTGSLDGDPFGSYETGAPRALVYDGLPPGERALLWLEGADHMTFGGNAERPLRGNAEVPLRGSSQEPLGGSAVLRRHRAAEQDEARLHALVARVTTLWWRTHLLGEAQARQALLAVPAGLGPRDRLELG